MTGQVADAKVSIPAEAAPQWGTAMIYSSLRAVVQSCRKGVIAGGNSGFRVLGTGRSFPKRGRLYFRRPRIMKSANIYIGLGSNLGDRAGNLLLGIRGMLDAGFEVKRLSQIYETEPVETFAQPLFLNMVAELRSDALPPAEEVMARLLLVERSLGRRRDTAKGPRTIDLDLLLYGNETRDTELLTLPHPRLHHRRFVLMPLAQLAPELLHPLLHRTINELLQETADTSEVKLWRPENERLKLTSEASG
jgi:2-amino-4-hydroxy-6-hydroxymethyldihydropteridine diphosphokinase